MSDTALDQLADIWVTVEFSERDLYERTVTAINARLAYGGAGLGESRGEGRRVWFNPPLVVIFREVPGCGIIISHVARLRIRPESDDE